MRIHQLLQISNHGKLVQNAFPAPAPMTIISRLPCSTTFNGPKHALSRITQRAFSNARALYTDISPFARRLYKLPTAPISISQNHNSLPTFITYATRIGLPESSTVYIGTHYEYTVQEKLAQSGLALHRIGGRDDAGIDLLGTWHLPERTGALALRVLVQCKALKTKLGPNLVRELEGALRQPPVGWRTGQTIGVLVSPREATKGVRDALARSSFPLFWMMVERDGALRQALWNGKVQELGLGPLGVETRYMAAKAGEDDVLHEMVFTWNGSDVLGMEEVERQLAGAEERWVGAWGEEFAGVERDLLLDAVEKAFPDGIPGLQTGEVTEAERVKARNALQEISGL